MKMKHSAASLAILTAAAGGLFASAATSSAATSYMFTAIPDTLGGSGSYALGINDSGQVVGDSFTTGDRATVKCCGQKIFRRLIF